MKSSFSRILVLALVSLCFSASAFAAGKAKSKHARTKAIEAPFDDTVEKLPAKYTSNNLVAIFAALVKNESKYGKSEFETSEVYQSRLLKLDETVLTGKLKYNSPVAFSLLTSFESTYDADSGTMTLSIPMTLIQDSDLHEAISYEIPGSGPYPYPEDLNGRAIEVFSSLTQSKKFTGSNAFGVKIRITGKIYDTFAVAVKNDNNLLKDGSRVSLSIPMAPDKAREAKMTGNILLVGELLHPFVGHGVSHVSATIDDPVEILDRIRYVAMKLTGIWYYSMKSGEIYHKQQVSYKNKNAE